ncbi:MAG: precorrin-6A reductase [Lachnospiraceae bacterium]
MKTGLIFGGTLDGRVLAETLVEYGYDIHLCVATECGKEMIAKAHERLTIHVGRLTIEEMKSLINDCKCDTVIDATHPYAVEVTKNIKEACTQVLYVRMLRESSDLSSACIVSSIEEACAIAKDGNILATTGSKEIKKYQCLPEYQRRLYARVLPTQESIDLCEAAGLDAEHIIKHLGVCSVEQNIELLEQYQIKTLITKDGGKTGGFIEKKLACEQMGIEFIVIKRANVEEGFSLSSLIAQYCTK